MGRVLHLGPSWHGPSFMWAELVGAELVLGRVVLHPFMAILWRTRRKVIPSIMASGDASVMTSYNEYS